MSYVIFVEAHKACKGVPLWVVKDHVSSWYDRYTTGEMTCVYSWGITKASDLNMVTMRYNNLFIYNRWHQMARPSSREKGLASPEDRVESLRERLVVRDGKIRLTRARNCTTGTRWSCEDRQGAFHRPDFQKAVKLRNGAVHTNQNLRNAYEFVVC